MGINRPLLYVAIAVGCLAVATSSLVYANSWWLSGIVTLSIGCWLAGILWAIYTPPGRRAAMLGALIGSFLYMLLSVGPWFQYHVGPWLLTTRALVAMDTYVLRRQPPAVPQAVNPGLYTTGFPMGGYTNYPVSVGSTLLTIPQWPTAAPEPSPSVAVGQWLFAWCAAAIGGMAASWIARRSQQAHASGATGESPVSEATP
jgi:hypothetical protein